MSAKNVIKGKEDNILVLNYEPKEFPVTVTTSAQDFVSAQQEGSSDFKISELTAEQVGINEIQRKSIERKIEERALARAKTIEEKAYKEAYELGLIEGTEKAFQMRREELEERVRDINTLLELFQEIKKRLLIENEQAFIKLATAIGSKIAMQEISGHQETIVKLLHTVVEELQAEDSIHVKISDEDLFFLESLREKTGNQIELLDRMKLEASGEIAKGGCIVETNNGTIDARVKNRVDKAWELMDGKMPKYKDKQQKTTGEEDVQAPVTGSEPDQGDDDQGEGSEGSQE